MARMTTVAGGRWPTAAVALNTVGFQRLTNCLRGQLSAAGTPLRLLLPKRLADFLVPGMGFRVGRKCMISDALRFLL